MYNANQEEQDILKFWDKDKTFEKSVSERSEKKPYVFYDGPPFATGLPHYGHFPSSIMKDVVPRYWTMKGWRVERRWGWDCHGLPIENIVEKELGTKSKKEIEQMGVAKFNELCRSKVLGYVDEWKKTIKRLGRWVDMEDAYRTMDRDYMESVWWVFKQLWEKGLIYEDYRSMHICPRCETTLSQQEVSEGYKDVKDISVFVKFKLTNANEKLGLDGEVYALAWTTTPWTLPGNVALAVGEDVGYVAITHEGQTYVLARARLEAVMGDKNFQAVKEIKGKTLVGLTYEPLFPYYKDTKNAFRVVGGDFVTTEDGTGVVHIAPGFGEDDFKVGKREQIPMVQHVGPDGRFTAAVTEFAGQEVKPRSDDDKVRLAADINIIRYLQEKGTFFAKQNLVHSYPHCWRCDTPLLNYATSSWFVKVTAIKEKALKLAEKINWSPEHIKEGRFGKWLEGARDWSISRQRFWASVMPVWYCGACKKYEVFGAVADLEKASGQKIDDLHKHCIDAITVPCAHCQGAMHRVPDVLDTWFDSGSMPYAQVHYPFQNKQKFEAGFPAQFIAEGQDQTRAWFYYLHVLATALFKDVAFKNVIVNGIVLAEDGKKMSKKLKNYPDPNLILEKYGADALRFYLLTSPVMHAESVNFSEAGVREVLSKVVNTLYNVVEFYRLFADTAPTSTPTAFKPTHVLDRWILAKLNELVQTVTTEMEAYRLAPAARPLLDFITELSQWYVRRSRDRFKSTSAEDSEDKADALATLRTVLETLAKIMAPFTPFIAEKVWYNVTRDTTSVHLQTWPSASKHSDASLLQAMAEARTIVEMGLALRAEHRIKVRQPLATLAINQKEVSVELRRMIADELNVQDVVFSKEAPAGKFEEKANGSLCVWLDTQVTEELRQAGIVRELIRTINQIRKEQGLTLKDVVTIEYHTNYAAFKDVLAKYSEEILRATLAKKLVSSAEPSQKFEIEGAEIKILVKKND